MITYKMAGLLLACGAVSAAAASLEEDEARIEALIRAERATAAARPIRVQAAPDTDTVPEPSVPVAAMVMAPAASPHDDWLARSPHEDGLPLSELAQHIGQRVSITTSNDRVHRGVLGSADEKQVTLSVKKPGGSAIYTLARNQIVRVDLR